MHYFSKALVLTVATLRARTRKPMMCRRRLNTAHMHTHMHTHMHMHTHTYTRPRRCGRTRKQMTCHRRLNTAHAHTGMRHVVDSTPRTQLLPRTPSPSLSILTSPPIIGITVLHAVPLQPSKLSLDSVQAHAHTGTRCVVDAVHAHRHAARCQHCAHTGNDEAALLTQCQDAAHAHAQTTTSDAHAHTGTRCIVDAVHTQADDEV
jgi:hypothetical protein